MLYLKKLRQRWFLRRLRHYLRIGSSLPFFEVSSLKPGEFQAYCLAAKELLENRVYRNEVTAIAEKHRQYLVQTAKTADDLVWGRLVLYVLSELENRFVQLARRAEAEKAFEKAEGPSY